MTTRRVNAPDTEPEELKFDLPSQKEHLLQVVDCGLVPNENDVYSLKIEVVGGNEQGRTLLHRVNIDDTKKSFYYCRMFLKAIGESYKGQFDISPERWIGRQFYATVIHNGKYANIDQYNFDKKVDNSNVPSPPSSPDTSSDPANIQWDN